VEKYHLEQKSNGGKGGKSRLVEYIPSSQTDIHKRYLKEWETQGQYGWTLGLLVRELQYNLNPYNSTRRVSERGM